MALFGGFLLSGVLTQPSDDRLPVVGASASATTEAEPTEAATSEPEPPVDAEADQQADTTIRSDLLPGVDLVTEEVEPGVYRIVNDGARDLSWTRDSDNPYAVLGGGVVADLDGSVWNVTAESPDRAEFYRLGDPAANRTKGMSGMQVDRDGRLWAFVKPDRGLVPLRSFDGKAWTQRRELPKKTFGWDALEAGVDGTVWASWLVDGGKEPNGYAIGRWTPRAGWIVGHEGTVALPDGEPNDVDLRLVASLGGGDMFVTSDRKFARLHGIAGGRYQLGPVMDPPVHRINHNGAFVEQGGLAATDDGTVWVDGTRRDGERVLARTTNLDDEDNWEVFEVAEYPATRGTLAETLLAPNLAGVATDGSAWLLGIFDRGDCDGIHRFDGSTWTTFLAGSCPVSVDFAADGAVWLQAANGGTVNTYVITPEAVAGTE